MTGYVVTAARSSDLDDAEIRRRLARAYAVILSTAREGSGKGEPDSAGLGTEAKIQSTFEKVKDEVDGDDE